MYSHVQWCTVLYSGVQCCTVVYSGVLWCTVVYIGVNREKFSFETDGHTHTQTDRAQVQGLSCAFAAKNPGGQ